MDRAYLEAKKDKLLKSAKRGLLLARAKLQNRLIVLVDKDGNTELTYDHTLKQEKGDRNCIRLNTGNEPNAIGFTGPISEVLRLLEDGNSLKASSELEGIFTSLQKALSPSSTSVQFLKMAKKNLNLACLIEKKKFSLKQIGEDGGLPTVEDDEPLIIKIE